MESDIKLKTSDRDKRFKAEFSKLKIKVALNWFELVALFLVSFFGMFKITSIYNIESILIRVVISIVTGVLIAVLFASFRKYQLKITRFDKEHIYKKISADLIDQSKSIN